MTLKSPNLKQTVSTLPVFSLLSSHLHFIFVKYDLILIIEYDHTLTLVSFTEPDFSGVDRGPGLHQGRTSIPAFQVVILLLFLAFGRDVVVVVVFVVVAVVFVFVVVVFVVIVDRTNDFIEFQQDTAHD